MDNVKGFYRKWDDLISSKNFSYFPFQTLLKYTHFSISNSHVTKRVISCFIFFTFFFFLYRFPFSLIRCKQMLDAVLEDELILNAAKTEIHTDGENTENGGRKVFVKLQVHAAISLNLFLAIPFR